MIPAQNKQVRLMKISMPSSTAAYWTKYLHTSWGTVSFSAVRSTTMKQQSTSKQHLTPDTAQTQHSTRLEMDLSFHHQKPRSTTYHFQFQRRSCYSYTIRNTKAKRLVLPPNHIEKENSQLLFAKSTVGHFSKYM